MFDASGIRLVSSGHDQTVRVWNAETGEAIAVLRGHTGLVTDVAFSPDDRRIGSSAHDMTVKLWDVESGDEAISLRDAAGQMACLAFHPDGQQLIAVHGRNIRAWTSHPKLSPKSEAEFEKANQAWHDQEVRRATVAQNFKAARFHAERLIAMSPLSSDYHTRLADVCGEMGEWQRAHQNFLVADILSPNDVGNLYGIAFANVQLGNLNGYRQTSVRLRGLINDKSPATQIHAAVWCSAIVPDAVPDPLILVELAQRTLAGANDQQRSQFSRTLGVAQYRAGQFEPARRSLEESIKLNTSVGRIIYVEDVYFLSMVESRLGHPDVAREWLTKADDFLAASPKTKPDGTPITVAWPVRFVRELLRSAIAARKVARASECESRERLVDVAHSLPQLIRFPENLCAHPASVVSILDHRGGMSLARASPRNPRSSGHG